MFFGLFMMLALPDSSQDPTVNEHIFIKGALLFLVALLSILLPFLWKKNRAEQN